MDTSCGCLIRQAVTRAFSGSSLQLHLTCHSSTASPRATPNGCSVLWMHTGGHHSTHSMEPKLLQSGSRLMGLMLCLMAWFIHTAHMLLQQDDDQPQPEDTFTQVLALLLLQIPLNPQTPLNAASGRGRPVPNGGSALSFSDGTTSSGSRTSSHRRPLSWSAAYGSPLSSGNRTPGRDPPFPCRSASPLPYESSPSWTAAAQLGTSSAWGNPQSGTCFCR